MKMWNGCYYDYFDVCRTFCKFDSVRRTTSILHYEWREYSIFQNVPEGTPTCSFYDDFYVCSAFFKFKPCMIHDYFSSSWVTGNPIFQKVMKTTQSARFVMVLMSLVHSGSFNLLRRRTYFLHYESLDRLSFQKLLGIPEITGFMVISIAVALSSTLSLVRRTTSILG